MRTVRGRVGVTTQAPSWLLSVAGCGFTARLRARGWSEENLAKLLGGNFLRVFREVLRPQ